MLRLMLFVMNVLVPLAMIGQDKIGASIFFDKAISDTSSVSRAIGGEVKFPWIEAYEFRTETRDFDIDKQEYTIRLSPSTGRKRRAQKAIYDHLNNAPDFESQDAYCDRVFLIYEDWLRLYVLSETLQNLSTMSQILSDRQTIYEKMAGVYEVDIRKLINLETDKNDVKIAMDQASLERGYILERYGFRNGDSVDFTNFIDIQEILAALEESGVNIAVDQSLEYEKELISRELELESAEDKQIFDFAQVKYNGPHTDLFQERISVGVGIKIPNSGNRKLKELELRLKQEEIEREQERDAQELTEQLENTKKELIRDIEGYRIYLETMDRERVNLNELGEQLSRKEGFAPNALLDIEERHISNQMKALKQREEILDDYINYLDGSGHMCGKGSLYYLEGI